MPYEGGLESHEHLKQQAADAQRRAQRRMAERQQMPGETVVRPQRRPWWAFWRRSERVQGTDETDTP